MTIGPTLHYSHSNVRQYWGLSILVYLGACFFWRFLTSGSLSVDLSGIAEQTQYGLGRFVVSPLSIYEYPWQILVLAIAMGILAVAPTVVSQLMSFRYSIPLILICALAAKLPLFALFLTVSCFAVACRPLRFRSRFISIVLCLVPQLVYWAIYGGYESVDPIRWGFSFSPWIGAWIAAVGMAGIVIAIGHFTRYRPGLVWSVSLVSLIAAAGIFQWKISFAELDYQRYVAGNHPEEVEEFHNHNLSKVLDDSMRDPSTRQFLARFFYPSDLQELREELKDDIMIQLGYDKWPNWFDVPDYLNYQSKRLWLLGQYDIFINQRPTSSRMPVALYYKAILKEYSPDIRYFGQTEILRFYKDYPHRENLAIWYTLFRDFPLSPESIEARWRIAVHYAGQEKFKEAIEQCQVAMVMLDKLEDENAAQRISVEDSLLTAFSPPARSAITPFKIGELRVRIRTLLSLIGDENIGDSESGRQRLARFVILNPYSLNYQSQLESLLAETQEGDPLRDNIQLSLAMLVEDPLQRMDCFTALTEQFLGTDGGIHALYELGVLHVQMWKETQEQEVRDQYLSRARVILNQIINTYPNSIYLDRARVLLNGLPQMETVEKAES